MSEKFDEVISVFSEKNRNILSAIPENVKSDTYEFRVRKNKPLVLSGSYGTAFVNEFSSVSYMDCRNCICISDTELKHIISEVCGYSVYSHQSDIINGFVTFGNGNRVGFCGTAVTDYEKVISVNNVVSLNIRIARENDCLGRKIASRLYNGAVPKGLIVAGAPCSGKTTVLKSLARILSSEYAYRFRKCVVIDERFEMINLSGINCDILSGYNKETGIIHAVRTLSPEIIICDEILSEKEAEKIKNGFDSGVSFIVSVHVSDKNDLMRRSVTRMLIESGCFDVIAILGVTQYGMDCEFIKTEDLINENLRGNSDCFQFMDDNFFIYKT